ncbi:hypothetical protein Pelo_5921 [Pelomyxa schiedti]|nr:hypothetical protein Pelo_5921 [Pelomyxa schiedti]
MGRGTGMNGLFLVMLSVAVVVIVGNTAGVLGSESVCWQGDEDCPDCDDLLSLNFNTLIYLSDDSNYRQAVGTDQDVIESASTGDDIIRMESLLDLHTTLNYFCCYKEEEKRTILDIIGAIQWNSINLTYSQYTCNADHDNVTVYLHAEPDQQEELFALVSSIESAIEAAGIPINNPRNQNFHNTHARVTPSYPSDEVVPKLDNVDRGIFHFYWFYSGTHVFYSQDSTPEMRQKAYTLFQSCSKKQE